jgi:O-antigen ligase
VEQMGKDLTLSGRTDLWEYLLNTPINPILGSGYQSFWLQSYAAELWAKYYFHPTQAHNGYIETYLQGGLLGLFLLLAMIAETGGKLKRELVQGDPYGSLRFTFLVVAIFYNWTEALFNKLSPVWIILLLAVLTCSREAMFFEKTSKNVNRSLLVVDPRRRISV